MGCSKILFENSIINLLQDDYIYMHNWDQLCIFHIYPLAISHSELEICRMMFYNGLYLEMGNVPKLWVITEWWNCQFIGSFPYQRKSEWNDNGFWSAGPILPPARCEEGWPAPTAGTGRVGEPIFLGAKIQVLGNHWVMMAMAKSWKLMVQNNDQPSP